ncbi:cysteine protease StiP family protein [Janthinobacterium fluminis]|uniref:Cysteine protease StiP family protein n=1 Tax=Janthinobacterium fluminis TaxID=2987524 RepID=A0ABT5K7A0_9BURK|nr:cysteine protease StiP family protein [Janthinobacterium fluminis]MDC8760530.1 cysteine protease StiP family protein [Janthinobacterium fluminis]
MSFSGSYRAGDVSFLLKPIGLEPILDLDEKERLIQSGQRHYSEMLSPEALPSAAYLALFRGAFAANRAQMARDCLRLAALIAARRDGAVTLVSLARAGTPVGVILGHLLRRVFARDCSHYSVSIIRDRGIDAVALRHILDQGHAPESIVFVDGWTGKGVISRELRRAVGAFNAARGTAIDAGLYVLSDLAGSAACAASGEDYLIPSSILNATVSGLVSRSVLNAAIGADDFHGCVYYEQFAAHDQSRQFADGLVADAVALAAGEGIPAAQAVDAAALAARSAAYMEQARQRYGIADVNLIKPGIGEATRVLLRRVPERLILRDAGAPDVAHLRQLAAEKSIPVTIEPALPYQAVALIRSAVDG